MIERKFVEQNLKEFIIQKHIRDTMKNVGHSGTKLQKTPMGEKITISVSRPGLVVGSRGENIKRLTSQLKTGFGLENPEIEISEVENPSLDAQIMAEKIASNMERFGLQRFKGIMHKTVEEVLRAGAHGVEVLLSGKIPSSRARSWRVFSGYMKKCGDIALVGVDKAQAYAHVKTGTVGVKVAIMPPTTKLPDDIKIIEEEGEIEKGEEILLKEESVKVDKKQEDSEAQKELKENIKKAKKAKKENVEDKK